jgi:hypothetical protein
VKKIIKNWENDEDSKEIADIAKKRRRESIKKICIDLTKEDEDVVVQKNSNSRKSLPSDKKNSSNFKKARKSENKGTVVQSSDKLSEKGSDQLADDGSGSDQLFDDGFDQLFDDDSDQLFEDEKLNKHGYVTWDIEMSEDDKKTMTHFCCEFNSEDKALLLNERFAIRVPLEKLPSCSRTVLSDRLYEVLKTYFKHEPWIVDAQIVRVPPHASRQVLHSDVSISYGLSVTLVIEFNSYVTTGVIPGSHLDQEKTTRVDDTLVIQPGLTENKSAMIYDSRIVHCGAENNTGVPLSSRIFFIFAPKLPPELLKQKIPQYYLPNAIKTTGKVLQQIDKDLGNTPIRYHFKEFQKGNIVTYYEEYNQTLVIYIFIYFCMNVVRFICLFVL